MGFNVLLDMPGHRRHVGTMNKKKHDLLYHLAKDWLDGKDIDF